MADFSYHSESYEMVDAPKLFPRAQPSEAAYRAHLENQKKSTAALATANQIFGADSLHCASNCP